MNDQSVKVLVVEDEEGLAKAMAGLLKVRGFDATYAVDGEEALKIFEENKHDLCMIDVQLGYSTIDGIEVLERVKKLQPQTECIMVTRITDKDSIKKAKELGASHYLLKPLDSKEWLNTVMNVAQQIRERRG